MPDPNSNQEGGREIALAPPYVAIPRDQAVAVARNISRALKRAANKSRAPAGIVTGGAYSTRPEDRLLRTGVAASFALIVILPVLFATIYWGLVASDQYVTEAKFALHTSDGPSFEALGVSAQEGRQIQDSLVVVRYILSRAMVGELEKSVDLRRKFSQADYLSRFDPSDPIEKLEKYWKRRVDATVDMMSGIVSFQIRAFTPADSLAIAQEVVELSEKLVNELSTRTRRDAVAQAKTELTRAEARLKTATTTMRDARNAEGLLDAPSAANAINKILTQLRLDLAKTEENVAALRESASTEESPQMRLLAARAESLKKQIADYSAAIAGKEGDATLAHRASALSAPEVELKFAEQQYGAAASAYEAARIDLERQRTYLALFLRPTLAEKAIYPRRWLEWSIIAGPAILIWSILLALALLARDHMAR